MIISVEEIKKELNFPNWSDAKIKRKLKAIEQAIRSFTNNNFQSRGYRKTANIVGGLFLVDSDVPFNVGDTVQVSESYLNKGLFTVEVVESAVFSVEEDVTDEKEVLVTKIEYPEDVVDCCVNLMDWELNHRDKVGIKSETLSRHSVTYEDSSTMVHGYPSSLLGGLKPYKKARC